MSTFRLYLEKSFHIILGISPVSLEAHNERRLALILLCLSCTLNTDVHLLETL